MKSKKEIRKEKLSWRNSISTELVLEKSSKIYKNLLDLKEFTDSEIVLSYMDFKNEVKTDLMINKAFLLHKRVFLPKVNTASMTMDFYEIDNISFLNEGYCGIKEPETDFHKLSYEDLANFSIFMAVPGVAFNMQGYRIGYGKGFYDKYLEDKPSIFKCGLCFEEQFTSDFYHDDSDIKMDCIITEERIINGFN